MEDTVLERLLAAAWSARTRAQTRGRRKVGAALLAADGQTFTGCNIQQKYHTHDLHAEVTAIAAMVSAGSAGIKAIVIVSDGEGVAPCGACVDWILEFGGDECRVVWQGENETSTQSVRAALLMPHHPPFA